MIQSYNYKPDEAKSIIQQLYDELFDIVGVAVFMKRDDLIHPEISGNKWRKLKYNLLKAREIAAPAILTFGGAFSNHIAATAALGRIYQTKTIGVIRGDEEAIKQNYVIQKAQKDGMQLHFIPRSDYSDKEEKDFLLELKSKFGDFYHIPEGGANYLGVCGSMEILSRHTDGFDIICVSAGTATTAAGLALSLKPHQKLWVFPAIKNHEEIKQKLKKTMEYALFDEELLTEKWKQVEFKESYHFGGFGKINAELWAFQKRYLERNQIELDFIYTSKMMYGINQEILKDKALKDKRLLAIHTGGLQGNYGFKKQIEKYENQII